MATAVSYQVTPEPNLSTYGSSVYNAQQPPHVVYKTLPPTVSGSPPIYQPAGVNSVSAAYRATTAGMPPVYQSASSFGNPLSSMVRSQLTPEGVNTTTSHVSGVVPTGLYTTYVPADHVHARDIHQVAGAPKKPVTVYYTDDLYPPYYSKAKKLSSVKKRSGCCA